MADLDSDLQYPAQEEEDFRVLDDRVVDLRTSRVLRDVSASLYVGDRTNDCMACQFPRIACQAMLYSQLCTRPRIVPVPVSPGTPGHISNLTLGNVDPVPWMDKAYMTALRGVIEWNLHSTTFISVPNEHHSVRFTVFGHPPAFYWTQPIASWDSALLIVKHTSSGLLDISGEDMNTVKEMVSM